MKYLIIISLLASLCACTSTPKRKTLMLRPVLDLLGNNAAGMTVTRVSGVNGVADPLFAEAMGADNTPGRVLSNSEYEPSSLELALHQRLVNHRSYPLLKQVLNPDNVVQCNANGSFTVDFAHLTVNEVEFMPGKRRRTFFYELGLAFKLLDAQGRLVFEREFISFKLQACIIKDNGLCQDLITSKSIDPKLTWLTILHTAFNNALQQSAFGLHDWAETLRHLKARVMISSDSDGQKLSTHKDATFTRNKNLADYPYLFLEIPEVAVKRLLADLAARGAVVNSEEQQILKSLVTTAMRSAIDQALQDKLKRSGLTQQAGIFLLPDAQAIWFRDALSRVRADRINADQIQIELSDQDERQRNDTGSIFTQEPCAGLKSHRGRDVCLSMMVLYKSSQTKLGQQQKNVQYAQQYAAFSGVLVDSKVDKQLDPDRRRFYPHGIKQPDQRILTEAASSDQYLRVMSEAKDAHDDTVYLRAAALDAAQILGYAIAQNIIQTFKEELLN